MFFVRQKRKSIDFLHRQIAWGMRMIGLLLSKHFIELGKKGGANHSTAIHLDDRSYHLTIGYHIVYKM